MNLSGIPTPALAVELISRPDGPSEYGKLLIAGRVYAKALRPCPHCAKPFGARDLRKHLPLCPLKPARSQTSA